MWDQITPAGAGFAHFDRQDGGKIFDGGIRDEKQKIARYECYVENRVLCCVALRYVTLRCVALKKCGKTHIGLFAVSFAPE